MRRQVPRARIAWSHRAGMPLVLVAYLALAVGLAMGAAHLVPALAIGGGVALGGALRRDARATALALVAIAGACAGALAARTDVACRARLEGARELVVTLSEIAVGGGTSRGTTDPCGVPVTLFVESGAAPAGAVVAVRGGITRSDRGLLARDAHVRVLGDGDPLAAQRARIGRTIDALFGSDAGLVRALVVADAASISRDVRDRFADAGLVHILSVSGLHVSIVAMALELTLGALRVRRRTASIAAAASVGGYVLLIGLPAPAVRAGTMLAAQLVSRVLQRPTSPWALLALGGIVPLLLEPRAVFDVGYLLSMAGMASLVGGRALANALGTGALRGWRRSIAQALVIGIVAGVATAPIVAATFGRVSLVGPIANIAAEPIVAVLQPALFLAVVLAPIAPLARLVASASHVLLRALDVVAEAAGNVPHAALAVSPSASVTALGAGAAVALLVACTARTRWMRARACIASAACVAGAMWSPLLPGVARDAVELHMLDVGQGDAFALRTPHGHWVLFDAGRVWRGGDAGTRTVLPYLRHYGGPVDAFVLSHPHADHVGGAASVLAALRPLRYWDAAYALGSDTYRASLVAARAAGVAWHRVRPDEELVVDGVTLRVLAPDSAWTASLTDPNLASVVVSVRWRGVRFLLVGDAEAPEEQWLVDRAAEDPSVADALRADVLKVAHHGSRTSSTPAFLALVHPRVALVSVGAGNTYGHPSPEVMQRLSEGGAAVLRTDRLGAVIVRATPRGRLTIEAGGESWSVP